MLQSWLFCDRKIFFALSIILFLQGHLFANDSEICGDFDHYINAQWKTDNPIPSTEGAWGSFNILVKNNENKMQGLLSEIIQKQYPKGSYKQQVKDLYLALLNTDERNNRGLEPLKNYFKLIDNAQSFNDLVILNAIIPGTSLPVEGSVFQDLMNSDKISFYFSASGLTLGDREYYLSEDENKANIREELKNYISRIAVLSGQKSKNARKTAEKILAIEKDIAQYHYTKEESRDPFKMYNLFSYQEAVALAPNIDWAKYFTTIGILPDQIIVTNPEIVKNLNKIIRNHSLKSWKEYMKFHLASSMASYLSEDYEKASFDFFATVLSGVKEQKPIQERAVRRMNSLLGESMGRLFVSHYFSNDSKEYIEHMIENMRSVFKERIENLGWMSDDTKKEALEKLASFTYKIGYPTKWKDLSSIKIDSKLLFENVMHIKTYHIKRELSKYGKEVDRDEWEMNAHEVNAYYHPLHNEIVFPAGILQPPFYDPNGDDGVNYGGIGAVIGHEFSHGFDDFGSRFDAKGNLRDWWKAEDREKFNELTSKLINQYSNFEILPGLHVNGEYTLGENIGDQGGLVLGYQALMKEYENKPEPPLTDDMNFKQRFFYGWAKIWRQNGTEEFFRQLIATNPHAPAKARINAALYNLQEFFEAFDCDVPDKESRVIIW